jgi:TonB family protein
VLLLVAFAVVICLPVATIAQQASPDASKAPRKVVHRVEPQYPWDLKRARIGGIVQLDLAISPKGTVDNVDVMGGNPILVQSAVEAVKRWKYAPADYSSRVRVSVEFNPDH